ncbi:MAG: hypothetical protein AAFW82_02425 [Pseudomonadota bacterium]
MTAAATIVWIATLWIYAGSAVAVVFLLIGIDRIDADARGSYTFRPLLVPGIILLWPLVLFRWLQLESGVDPNRSRDRAIRSAHGWVWALLAILIPALFISAMLLRQTPPDGEPAVQLSTRQD